MNPTQEEDATDCHHNAPRLRIIRYERKKPALYGAMTSSSEEEQRNRAQNSNDAKIGREHFLLFLLVTTVIT
jgi:hypothetical protein